MTSLQSYFSNTRTTLITLYISYKLINVRNPLMKRLYLKGIIPGMKVERHVDVVGVSVKT